MFTQHIVCNIGEYFTNLLCYLYFLWNMNIWFIRWCARIGGTSMRCWCKRLCGDSLRSWCYRTNCKRRRVLIAFNIRIWWVLPVSTQIWGSDWLSYFFIARKWNCCLIHFLNHWILLGLFTVLILFELSNQFCIISFHEKKKYRTKRTIVKIKLLKCSSKKSCYHYPYVNNHHNAYNL